MKVTRSGIWPDGSQPAKNREDSRDENEPAKNELFYSREFSYVTMNKYGTVIDKGGRQASLELSNWVIAEAIRAGWRLEYENRDVGNVWKEPITSTTSPVRNISK